MSKRTTDDTLKKTRSWTWAQHRGIYAPSEAPKPPEQQNLPRPATAAAAAAPAAVAVAAANTTVPIYKKYNATGRMTPTGTFLVDGKPMAYHMNSAMAVFLRNDKGDVILRVVDPYGLDIQRLPVIPSDSPILSESDLPLHILGMGHLMNSKGGFVKRCFIAVGDLDTGIIRVDCDSMPEFYLTFTPATEERADVH